MSKVWDNLEVQLRGLKFYSLYDDVKPASQQTSWFVYLLSEAKNREKSTSFIDLLSIDEASRFPSF